MYYLFVFVHRLSASPPVCECIWPLRCPTLNKMRFLLSDLGRMRSSLADLLFFSQTHVKR